MRIRDDDWLKTSALYWDSIRRFKPTRYRLRDSLVGKQLAEAGFLQSLSPEPYAADVSYELLTFMKQNTEILRQRFSIQAALAEPSGPGWGTEGPSGRHPNLGWVHSRKMSKEFATFLTEEGLGQVGRGTDDQWVGLHPTVAAAYMLALVGACAGSEGLDPVTDYPGPLLSPTEGLEAAIRLLTANTDLYQNPSHASYDAAGFAILAIETVMPSNIANISVERILSTKSKLEEELVAFRNFVAQQQPELEHLASIQNDDIRAEAFTTHISSEIKKPLERLERGLRLSSINTVRSLLTLQTIRPPAIVLGLDYVTHARPAVTAIEAAATVIGTAWWQLVEGRQRQIHKSPFGYLLSVKRELSPRTFAERTAQVLGRVY